MTKGKTWPVREFQAYRVAADHVVEVWDWDIILMHGSVYVQGMSRVHLEHCAIKQGHPCSCGLGRHPRTSSPVLDPDTHRELKEAWYQGDPLTGEAHFLLSAEDGTVLPVFSGKVYRLVGPRKKEGYSGYSSGSIFRVYAEPEPEPEAPTWWTWLACALGLRKDV